MKKSNILFLFVLLTYNSFAQLKPAKIFSDNMVLQRGSEIPVWGTANPGEQIIVRLITSEIKTIVQPDGRWMVKIPNTNAGGPYSLLIASGSERIEFKNVLIGDVWFASGQSNMEHPMKGWEWIPHSAVNQSALEIADSNYPEIRLFSAPKYPSPVQLNDLSGGKWEIACPTSVSEFSSVGWFFAKELYKTLKVPIGIINSSWGGVPIQSLMSRESLNPYKSSVMITPIPEKFIQTKWTHKVAESLEKNRIRRNQISYAQTELSEKINSLNYVDSDWIVIDFPNENMHYGNVVWFRKKIVIPESFHKHKLLLSLGFLDRQSQVFLNGTEIGFYLYPQPVEIEIPETLIHSGENILSIRLVQPFGNSKVFCKKGQYYLTNSSRTLLLDLSAMWKANDKLEPINHATEMYQNNPTYLFNGMVAPIIPYAIKGFIWYQGEANAGEPALYTQLFQGLITDWRQRWNSTDLPFLFVQTSNIELSHQFEKKSDTWCLLREAQQKALSLPNTGMAVSLDIGDPYDVHPKNKQDFAHRLVLQALKVAYNQDVISDGPTYSSIKTNRNTLIIRMNDSLNQLKTINSKNLSGFEIAGVDKRFYEAKARSKNNQIYVFSNNVKNPVSVRYAWSNNPKCSLYNTNGLPTAPFFVAIK